MKSSKSLSQRRSLAAKRGWDSRRKKKLDAAWAGIAERAKTAPVVPCPEQVIADIDRAHREREAQSKHPGSPEHMANIDELATVLRSMHDDNADYGRINNLGGYDNHNMKWARAVLAKVGKPVPDEMGAKSEARSELLLTEGMRVRYGRYGDSHVEKTPIKSRFYGIRDLIDRFVKTLRGKA